MSKPKLNSSFKFKKSEFEEDITIPFESIFSMSAKLEFENKPNLNTFGDILTIYPDLDFDIPSAEKLVRVNNFMAEEFSYDLGKIVIDDKNDAKVQLAVWYKYELPNDNNAKDVSRDKHKVPVIVEFDIDVKAQKVLNSEDNVIKEFPESVVKVIDKFYKDL